MSIRNSPEAGGGVSSPFGRSPNSACLVTRTRTPFLPQGTIQMRSWFFFQRSPLSIREAKSCMEQAYPLPVDR
jgi:hypothetical protein